MRNLCLILLTVFIFTACKESEHQHLARMVTEWQNKQILFPTNMLLTNLSGESVPFNRIKCKYTIVTYIDSIGCMSCKLKLTEWRSLIEQLNVEKPNTVCVLLAFYSTNRQEIKYLLKRDVFNYPVFFDEQDSLNMLNHFPIEDSFRSFLLDSDDKVIAIGNPIYNPQIKDLYLSHIIGRKTVKENLTPQTDILIKQTSISLKNFDWRKEQKVSFYLQNVGEYPLVIDDVITSCGCVSVTYNKEPVRSDGILDMNVVYKAENQGYFDKTLTVYCNAKSSPIELKLTGNP